MLTYGAPTLTFQIAENKSGLESYMKIDGHRVKQILLPDDNDTDPHPRLIFNGWGFMLVTHSQHSFRTAGQISRLKSSGTQPDQSAGIFRVIQISVQ